jgi:hypothetical protein
MERRFSKCKNLSGQQVDAHMQTELQHMVTDSTPTYNVHNFFVKSGMNRNEVAAIYSLTSSSFFQVDVKKVPTNTSSTKPKDFGTWCR